MQVHMYLLSITCLILILPLAVSPVYGDSGYTDGGFMSMPTWLYERYKNTLYSTVVGGPPDEDEIIPTFDSWMAEGDAALSGGAYREAVTAYEKAISMRGTSYLAWEGRAMALEGLGRYQSAIDCYEKALTLRGVGNDIWKMYGGIGRCYFELSRYQDAVVMLERSIELYNTAAANDPETLADLEDKLEVSRWYVGESHALATSVFVPTET